MRSTMAAIPVDWPGTSMGSLCAEDEYCVCLVPTAGSSQLLFMSHSSTLNALAVFLTHVARNLLSIHPYVGMEQGANEKACLIVRRRSSSTSCSISQSDGSVEHMETLSRVRTEMLHLYNSPPFSACPS